MLTALPPLAPLSAHALFHPSLNPPSNTSHNSNSNNQTRQTQPGPQHQNQYQSQQPTRTLLSILRADEHAVLLRRANIRRFGASWLRPAGVAKTLQGLADEQAEREEAEAGAARDYSLADAQGLPDTDIPSSPEDRDLDDDVPEADDDGEGGWVDEEDEEDDGLDAQGHPLNGNGAPIVLDRDNLGMNADGDEEYAHGERDLDDDIPEGMDGSYQHTDTDVEDDSSFEDAEADADAEVEVQPIVSARSAWSSSTGGATGGHFSPSGGARGAGGRRSGARMPGREN